jgi:hypothetical protein
MLEELRKTRDLSQDKLLPGRDFVPALLRVPFLGSNPS